MGIGREVADAYISVHGDLSPFRRELNKAGKDAEQAARENAKTFTDAWGEQAQKDINKKWGDILQSTYSGDTLDLGRLIDEFDSTDIDNAHKKINDFMGSMRDSGKMTEEQYRDTKKALNEGVDALRIQQIIEEDLADDRRKAILKQQDIEQGLNDARILWNNSHNKMMNEFHNAQIRRTLEQRKREEALARDQTMWLQAAQRMTAGLNAARKQAVIDQERLSKSFAGMIDKAKEMDLDRRMRDLSNAMATMDFSRLAQGSDNMEQMRRRTMATAREMHALGRMTDEDMDRIRTQLQLVSRDMDGHNVRFREANRQSSKHSRDWSIIQRMIGNAGKKFAGFSGLNVLGDAFRDGAQFFQNLDRNAVKISKMVVLIGSAASIVLHAVGALAVMGQDLAAIGNLGILAPGFLTAMGIGIGVLVAAMKDAGVVLKDLGPQFGALQDSISKEFWAEAEQPIRNLVSNLFPTLQTQLAITATGMGALIAAFAEAFQGAATPERVTGMFEKMNSAITILAGAMEPLVSAFVTMGEIGSQYFERFSQWIVDISTTFNNFIQKAAADGRMNEWIDTAITNLQALGSIVGSIVNIWNAIGDAAKNAGIGGLLPFAAALDAVAKTMSAPMFQTALTQLFAGAAEASRKVGEAIGRIGPDIAAFMPVLANVLTTVGQVASTVIAYIGQIMSNPALQAGIGSFIAGALTAIQALAPAIEPMGNSLGQIGGLLGQVLGQVGQILTALITNLSPVLDIITAAFGRITFAAGPEIVGLIGQIGEVLRPVIDTLLPPLENLIMTVLPLLGAAFGAVSPIIGALASFIAPVIGAISKLVAMIMPSLIPALEKISAAVTPVIEVLGLVVGFILSILVPILGFLLIGIINNLVGVFQGLSNFIMGFVQIVTAIFTGFGEFFTKLFQGDIGGALGALGTMFASIWDGILQMLIGVLEFLWNAVQLIFVGKMIGGIVKGLGALKGFFAGAWGDILAFFKMILGNLGEAGTMAFATIRLMIQTALTAIKTFFTTTWTNILTFIRTTLTNVSGSISTSFNAVKAFISTLWNTIVTVLKLAWSAIVSTIKGRITEAKNTITVVFNTIKAYISTVWSNVTSAVSGAWSRIVSAVSTGVGNVMSWITSLPGKVSGALGNLGNLLWNAGKAIIDGLLNGLKATWGSVTSFVGGIADWIANNKGPLPYDRRLLIPAGNAIMEGLGKGLMDKLGMLKSVLDTVTGTMTDNVMDAFAKSKMYIAGADAAMGLADGLKSNKNAVANALGAVLPSTSSTVGVNLTGAGRPGAPAGEESGRGNTIINVAAGAIPVTTPTKDPELVASKVIDGFANYSNL